MIFNMKKFYLFLLFCSAILTTWGAETLGVTDKLKSLWENPVTESRIESGIRANRMGEFFINFNVPVDELKVKLVRHEFLFGLYASRLVSKGQKIEYTDEQCKTYAKLYKDVFNYGTIATVWRRVEPQRGKFRWDYSNDANIDLSYMKNPTVAQPDIALNFCEENGITPKGHTFYWPISSQHFMPAWALELKNPAEIESASNRNIRNICNRYRDRIKIWDIVNEAASYRDKHTILNNDYVFKTFKEAEKYLPSDDIFIINETTGAWASYLKDTQTSRFYLLVKDLIHRGAKLDAIGLQYHIFSQKLFEQILSGNTYKPRDISRVLDGYAKLGKPIHITEITIPTTNGEQAQAYFARQIYRLFFSHPAVEAITWWNMRDGQAAPSEKKLNGGLLRHNLTPKASYEALKQLITVDWQTNISFNETTSEAHFEGFFGMYEVSYKYKGKEYKQNVWFGKKDEREQQLNSIPLDYRNLFQ